MKKLLMSVLLLITTCFVNAQVGKVGLGANLGLTTGAGDTNFVLGADLQYLFEADTKFDVGGATGLIFETETNAIVLPLAVAGRFNATQEISFGLDLGYAIGINKSGNGFYFRPIFGYNLSEEIQLRASYSGIESSGYFNVGAIFNL